MRNNMACPPSSLKTVFNLPRDCSLSDLNRSYKRLCLKYHPDKDPSPGATARFQQLNRAFLECTRYVKGPNHADYRCEASTGRHSADLDEQLRDIARRLQEMEKRLDEMMKRLEEISRRLDELDKRLDETEKRLKEMERRYQPTPASSSAPAKKGGHFAPKQQEAKKEPPREPDAPQQAPNVPLSTGAHQQKSGKRRLSSVRLFHLLLTATGLSYE